MCSYSLTHVSDRDLLRDSVALATQESATTAKLLAHIGEIDARRLCLPAGYSSMFAYSVQELHLSEDAAYRRIQAARTARQFPAVFTALAKGRLHLTAVLLLGPHLTSANADELLGAAARKSKSEIELLLAQRFPKTELLPMVQALPASAPPNGRLAPERVRSHRAASVRDLPEQLAPERVAAPAPRSQVKPVAPQRFALHLMIDQSTYDDLQYLRTLLSHQVPSGSTYEKLQYGPPRTGFTLRGVPSAR